MSGQGAADPAGLADPNLYAVGRGRTVWADLRAAGTPHREVDPSGRSFTSLLRYRQVRDAYRDWQTYTSERGIRLDAEDEAVNAASGRLLLVSDPPKHSALREAFAPVVGPEALQRARGRIEDIARELLRGVIGGGGVVADFVPAVARPLPNRVICFVLGLPEADHVSIGDMTETALTGETGRVRSEANAELFAYCFDAIADGMLSAAVERVGVEHVVLNLHGLLLAANETTRYAAAGAVQAFSEFPKQWQLVRNDRSLVPRAVEEILRWTTPGMHVVRVATRQVTLEGVEIQEGERVVLWLGSANDDERVFSWPLTFDISRRPNPHLTFGAGPHSCIGSKLARLELLSLINALADAAAEIEVVGEPSRLVSNHLQGFTSMDVRLG